MVQDTKLYDVLGEQASLAIRPRRTLRRLNPFSLSSLSLSQASLPTARYTRSAPTASLASCRTDIPSRVLKAAELKKAYRSLSLRHHPDRQASSNGTDGPPPDHSKFQEIQNAYETLSDPERRDEYDHFGEKGARGAGAGGGMDEEEFMNSFMDSMFGPPPGMGRGGGPPPRPRQRRKTQTPPSEIDLALTLEELYCGCTKTIAIERKRTCASCKGTGAKPNKQAKPCVKCNGQGQTFAMRTMGAYMVRQPVMCSACEGRGLRVRDQDQ